MTKWHKQKGRVLSLRGTAGDNALAQARDLFDRLMAGSHEGFPRADRLTERMWDLLRTSRYPVKMLDRSGQRTPEGIHEAANAMTAALLDRSAVKRLEELQQTPPVAFSQDAAHFADDVVSLLDSADHYRPPQNRDERACRIDARQTAFRAAAEHLLAVAAATPQRQAKIAKRLRATAEICADKAKTFHL